MSVKVFFLFCVQTFFLQNALSQCTSRAAVAADSGYYGPAAYGLGSPYGLGVPYGFTAPVPYGYTESAYGALCGLSAPWGYTSALDFSPTSGGALPVSSGSALPPTGISIVSDNIFEGPLAVAGELPFVGTVAMEGVLPSIGAGVINHACGNGINEMVVDTSAFTPDYVGAYAPGLIAPTLGYQGDY